MNRWHQPIYEALFFLLLLLLNQKISALVQSYRSFQRLRRCQRCNPPSSSLSLLTHFRSSSASFVLDAAVWQSKQLLPAWLFLMAVASITYSIPICTLEWSYISLQTLELLTAINNLCYWWLLKSLVIDRTSIHYQVWISIRALAFQSSHRL